MFCRATAFVGIAALVSAMLLCGAYAAQCALNLGSEEFVQANGVDINVPGYSVPCYADWNNDGKKDLIVGEGGNWFTPLVRVYLNTGTASEPNFADYFYAEKSDGRDIAYVGRECICSAQGLFPRVVYWDDDSKKDLLIGQHDGTIRIYLNVGTDEDPVFDSGTFVKVGEPGFKVKIDVGDVTSVWVVDWDNDGRKDLAVGANDGKVRLFINEGTDTEPDFLVETFAQEDAAALVVPSHGASPTVLDLDDDSNKDLLTGNTDGQVLLYSNMGTDAAPAFSGYWLVESDGVPIQVDAVTGASPRSRPFVCDWTDDGYPDVLVGAGDGKVYLYQSTPQAGDIDKDYDVDLYDFAVLASAWTSSPGDSNWNPVCDISEPNDNIIDLLDLDILTQNWLEGVD
ncbi:MAG: FG-GAP repeat domain-containing protein [Planctomycetota bacterium]